MSRSQIGGFLGAGVVAAWFVLQGIATMWPLFTDKTVPALLAEEGWLRMNATVFGWASLVVGLLICGLLVTNLIGGFRGKSRVAEKQSSPDGPDLHGYFHPPPRVLRADGELTLVMPFTIGNSGAQTEVFNLGAALVRTDQHQEILEVLGSSPLGFNFSSRDGRDISITNTELLPQMLYRRELARHAAVTGYLVMRSENLTAAMLVGATLVISFKDRRGHECQYFSRLPSTPPPVSQPVVVLPGSEGGSSGDTPHKDGKKSE